MRRARHHHAFLLASLLLPCVMAACASAVPAGAGGAGGYGGASSSATAAATSSAATGTSSSSGHGGESSDGGDAGSCSRCADALHGPDHIAAITSFCASDDAGDGPYAYWAAYVNCGCSPAPGPCYSDCKGSAYCAGVFPARGTWGDPTGQCKACLGAAGVTGCGDSALACEKN